MIFGLKKIDHQLIFLDNDDVETPTALVGKKVGVIDKHIQLYVITLKTSIGRFLPGGAYLGVRGRGWLSCLPTREHGHRQAYG